MLRKLRHQLYQCKITQNNRNPNMRSRLFLVNYLRRRRFHKTSAPLRGSLGLTWWTIARAHAVEVPEAPRIGCFITGRARGLTQRFSVARTKIKELSSEAVLFGVRKSSW